MDYYMLILIQVNIALKNNKLILIDFGWSVKLGDGIGKNKDRYPEYPAF